MQATPYSRESLNIKSRISLEGHLRQSEFWHEDAINALSHVPSALLSHLKSWMNFGILMTSHFKSLPFSPEITLQNHGCNQEMQVNWFPRGSLGWVEKGYWCINTPASPSSRGLILRCDLHVVSPGQSQDQIPGTLRGNLLTIMNWSSLYHPPHSFVCTSWNHLTNRSSIPKSSAQHLFWGNSKIGAREAKGFLFLSLEGSLFH